MSGFTTGQIVRHRATGQRGVVIRVEDGHYAIDYGFGERGATMVAECVIEADEQEKPE